MPPGDLRMKNPQRSLWDQPPTATAPRDITARKHGGDNESTAAFQSRDRSSDRLAVIEFIKLRGADGATADEFAEHHGRQLNQVSGRFSELKLEGVIEPNGQKRPTRAGCSSKAYVLRLSGK